MLMRNTSRGDKSKFSPEHIQRVQKSLKLRLHFLTQVNQIPLENVFNLAETFVAASVWWSDMRSTQFASIGGSRGGWWEFHLLLRFNTVTVVSPHLYSFGTMTTTVAFLLSAVLRAAASRSSSSSYRLQDRCESRDAKKSLDNTLPPLVSLGGRVWMGTGEGGRGRDRGRCVGDGRLGVAGLGGEVFLVMMVSPAAMIPAHGHPGAFLHCAG